MKHPKAIYAQRDAVTLECRDLTVRNLSLRAKSIDEEARTVEAVLATENVATVFDFERFQVIDEILLVDGARFGDQVVMLESHMRYSLDAVLGSIRGMRIEGKKLIGTLHFAAGDERAESAWLKVRQGHITDVSVGYKVEKWDTVPANTKKTINGRSFEAGDKPLRVSTEWKVREASLVPIGADEFAQIRQDTSRAVSNKRGTRSMEKLRELLEKYGLRADATEQEALEYHQQLEGEQRTSADALLVKGDPPDTTPKEPNPEPKRNEPAPPVDAEALAREAAQEAVRMERGRITKLREMAGEEVPSTILERAISDGWDAERAGQEFLTAIREAAPAPLGQPTNLGIISRSHDRACTEVVLATALAIRGGIDPLKMEINGIKHRDKAEVERIANQADEFTAMSLMDLCRESLRMACQAIPHRRDELIKRALSTGSLSNIFTTSINAQLMKSFTEAPDTTDGWVLAVDVNNFQTQERIRTGPAESLEKLPIGGEAPHATFGDTKEEYKIARYAKQIVLDERDIINDNMSALLELPRKMGIAAARLRPDLVYSILLANSALADTVTLFHVSSHGANLGSAVLAAAGLKAGIAIMGKQTEANGDEDVNLNIEPRYLLVPVDLGFTAKELIHSAQILITGDADIERGNKNVLADLDINIRIDNRIGVAGVKDPSTGTKHVGLATNWFLVGSPNQSPTIEVGYLAGTGRRPQVRRFVLTQGRWGIGWDINHDIGAKALAYQALYKSTGV